MVPLPKILSSNATLQATYPPSPTAVFIGGTAGIGAGALKAFATHTIRPRIFIIGRSDASAAKLIAECRQINAEGEYVWVKGDVSTMKGTEKVCREVQARIRTGGKEGKVDLLVLSALTADVERKLNLDNLPAMTVYCHYSRALACVLFLPNLTLSPVARILNIFYGALEGYLYVNDLAATSVSFLSIRPHFATLSTLGTEAIAQRPGAENVAFISYYPGAVKTGLLDKLEGWFIIVVRAILWVAMWFVEVKMEECGERCVFVATNAMYPANGGAKEGVEVAPATDGSAGGGVYSLAWDREWGKEESGVVEEIQGDGSAGAGLEGFRRCLG